MAEQHPFDVGIALEHSDDGTLRGRTDPGWNNMVGPFGGITAATLLHAIESQPDAHGAPLTLTVNFLAPIADGEFQVSARALRTNRTNQHWYAELSQDGAPKTTATAIFGIRRETWSDTELIAPDVPVPEDLPEPGTPRGVAVWIGNYDMRVIEGPYPGPDDGPSPSSLTKLWVRDRRGRTHDYAALTALCDIFYPRSYVRRAQVGPAGTISMTIYFHADSAELQSVGDDFLLGCARGNRFLNGYFDQSAELWSRSGALLATTHQLVYFKA